MVKTTSVACPASSLGGGCSSGHLYMYIGTSHLSLSWSLSQEYIYSQVSHISCYPSPKRSFDPIHFWDIGWAGEKRTLLVLIAEEVILIEITQKVNLSSFRLLSVVLVSYRPHCCKTILCPRDNFCHLRPRQWSSRSPVGRPSTVLFFPVNGYMSI